MAINYEVVSPINDRRLVEDVAIAITRADPYFATLKWSQTTADFREDKRDEARAAIAVVLQYLINLEGANHGHQ